MKDVATGEIRLIEDPRMEFDATRAVAQVQGAMAIAKRFPRNENDAMNRILAAAGRKRLAEQAEYEYKKGGALVAGPSIRAAEAVAQAWGNMISGITEVERDTENRESLMLAYAADMETNNWKFLEFRVPHTIDTRDGTRQLESGRDIYERTMNDGSRRLRNCLLAVIPGDVIDTFLDRCNETMNKSDVPLKARIDGMVKGMAEFHVTQPMIEHKMGCHVSALTERQLSQLRRIYQSIKDGFGKVPDYFKDGPMDKTNDFKENLGAPAKEEPKPKPKADSKPNAKKEEAKAAVKDDDMPTREQAASQLFATADRMGLDVDNLAKACQDLFKKNPDKLTVGEMLNLRNEINLGKVGK